MNTGETEESSKSSEANRNRGEARSDPRTLELFLKEQTGEERRGQAGGGAADVRRSVGGREGVHEGSRRLWDKQSDQGRTKYGLRPPLVPKDQKHFQPGVGGRSPPRKAGPALRHHVCFWAVLVAASSPMAQGVLTKLSSKACL